MKMPKWIIEKFKKEGRDIEGNDTEDKFQTPSLTTIKPIQHIVKDTTTCPTGTNMAITPKRTSLSRPILGRPAPGDEEDPKLDDVNTYFKKAPNGIYVKFMHRLIMEMSDEDVRTILLEIQDKISKPNRMLEEFHLSKEAETAIIEFLVDQG
jgi:hypothetical protein